MPANSQRLTVTVVITTRNRSDDVLRAIASCQLQIEPCEVLVYDDASSDSTSEILRSLDPGVRVIRCETHCGLISLRNRGFRDATGEIIVSIDDDAYFTSPDTLTQIVSLFEEFPRAAAFALPFVEPHSGRETMPFRPRGTRMRNFMGCAHAIRRQAALALGGYPECLIHQGEERDLSIRLLDHGDEILLADTPPIVHLCSPQRDHARVNYYGFRNAILFCWMRLPFPECLWRAVGNTLMLLTHRFCWPQLGTRVHALAAGWLGAFTHRSWRVPVSRATVRAFRQRLGHGPLPCDVTTPPPVSSASASSVPASSAAEQWSSLPR